MAIRRTNRKRQDDPDDVISVAPLDPGLLESWSGDVVRVYADAFRQPPYSRTEPQVMGFASAHRRHVERAGFRGFAAIHRGRVVGFTYGYTSRPGQWWHDQVRVALGPGADRWLIDAFEYVELAVLPSHQGRGIGRSLHDHLIASQEHSRAVLSTLAEPTAGSHLYTTTGWMVLYRGFRFERTTTSYDIMGLDLRHRPARQDG